jgi:RNA polymerase sigma factor (sigma-70 family)
MDDWQQMVRDYGALVYTAAWRILQHRQDTEDVVQDVFLHAWRSRDEEPVAQWGGWLRRLAVCRALDRLRRRRDLPGLDSEEIASPASSSSAMEFSEMQEQLRAAVAELPERERVVFSLRYFEAIGNSEIARLLAISESAVSTALNKARNKLAMRIQPTLQGEQR